MGKEITACLRGNHVLMSDLMCVLELGKQWLLLLSEAARSWFLITHASAQILGPPDSRLHWQLPNGSAHFCPVEVSGLCDVTAGGWMLHDRDQPPVRRFPLSAFPARAAGCH